MALLAQRPDRYLHAPRLIRGDREGGAHVELVCIAWRPTENRECLLRLALEAPDRLGPELQGESREAIVALTRGDRAAISDDPLAEQREERAGSRVWVEHAEGVASVWLSPRGGADVLVFRARGSVAAPCLALAERGIWVAFHHDVREDTAHADVAKWIALRFVDASGAVFEPAAPMLERDRDREGVEQSFEFPGLCVNPDGAVSVFGRGSHNFWRQDLSAGGFSPRSALSDGEWGSRGRHVSVLESEQGIWVARRERKGIQVDLLPHALGGTPELQLAKVDWSADSVSERVLPSVARAPRDPARKSGLITLFGDIQQHSAHSDGVGSADEVYLRARDRYEDDFVALTDHESFLGKRTGPGEWEYLQRVAEHYDAPGAFATLYAYEWTGRAFPGPGHKCVYYPLRGVPIVSRDDVPEGRQLVAAVQRLGGFASPHHIGWTGADEAGHDDHGQPLWEICSCHGCYEHVGHPLGQRGELKDHMADVMLRRGHRFGFTASSDSHGLLWHHGEARKRDPYRTGLTAVQAAEVSRAAVMEALRLRRCYATSGAKILLDVRADGHAMGSELGELEAEFEVQAHGTTNLRSIELVGYEGVLAQGELSGPAGQLRARVSSPFVYARVVQEDGEMAWSSPVFLGPKRS
ncbi:MAG: CehA/McbA family metallohydrolase [Myxococcales bacterium]